ncbi:hypothetical protein DM02DRAFT_677047 [Periconia macrospinosa]|uniref:Extracellular membrane protein CFEM domain-containing protein n=1 Tax=Periconia macrospinosa TaxID=97972 RepID=A0A2V1D564_9PLEO|nr:hypothetical protein DM02DRAFT_677047 [Periconia macrospinosa]
MFCNSLHVLCFGLLFSVTAQDFTAVPQASCLNAAARTATGYGKCESMMSEVMRCDASVSTNKPAAASCFCRQEILNSILECQNESNFCSGMNNGYLWANTVKYWHEKCDTKISFSPTTPVLSTYSSIDINACSTAWEGCVIQSAEISRCRTLSAQSSQLTSCMCRPALLSAAFTCSYYANVSCTMVPGTLSEVQGYEYCTGFMGVVGPLANLSCRGQLVREKIVKAGRQVTEMEPFDGKHIESISMRVLGATGSKNTWDTLAQLNETLIEEVELSNIDNAVSDWEYKRFTVELATTRQKYLGVVSSSASRMETGLPIDGIILSISLCVWV